LVTQNSLSDFISQILFCFCLKKHVRIQGMTKSFLCGKKEWQVQRFKNFSKNGSICISASIDNKIKLDLKKRTLSWILGCTIKKSKSFFRFLTKIDFFRGDGLKHLGQNEWFFLEVIQCLEGTGFFLTFFCEIWSFFRYWTSQERIIYFGWNF
jgi:hypothetical protein